MLKVFKVIGNDIMWRIIHQFLLVLHTNYDYLYATALSRHDQLSTTVFALVSTQQSHTHIHHRG